MSDVENDILSSMGIEDNEESTTEQAETSVPQEDPATGQLEPTVSDSSAPNVPSEQPAPTPAQPDVADNERLKQDARGNLVNERGQVVATAGRERRYFERAQKASQVAERQGAYIRDLEQRVRQVETTAQSSTALNGLPQQLGLNSDEASMGLRLIQSYKKDPIATIKYILTEAAASGHNVNDLIGREGGIDMGAISRMMDQRLAPVTERYTQEQQQVAARREAEQQINQFYARYPDAPIHEEVIGKMLQADPSLSLEGAYANLLRVAQANQLDFTKPLRPQLEAKRNAPQASAGRPMPTGRAVQNNPVPAGNTPASDSMSYKDIIRQSMAAAGMTFNN